MLRDVLALEPQLIDAKELLAEILAERGRSGEAIMMARALCAVNPRPLSSQLVLAGVLMETGHLDEALAEAQVAVSIAPADARPYSALGAVFIGMNDGIRALAAFEQMYERVGTGIEKRSQPDRVSCAAGRAIALSLLGRHNEPSRLLKQFTMVVLSVFKTYGPRRADFFKTFPPLS